MTTTANRLRWIAVGVLLAAFAVRAYNLGGTSLWYDEAVFANNSAQSFDRFITLTRTANSAPVALPLLLWFFGEAIRDRFRFAFRRSSSEFWPLP
jgi:hypothetical protein